MCIYLAIVSSDGGAAVGLGRQQIMPNRGRRFRVRRLRVDMTSPFHVQQGDADGDAGLAVQFAVFNRFVGAGENLELNVRRGEIRMRAHKGSDRQGRHGQRTGAAEEVF